MNRAEDETAPRTSFAKCPDIFDVKDQLYNGLTQSHSLANGMNHQIRAAVCGDQLDDPIAGETKNPETEVPFVKAHGCLDIARVEQDSTQS